MKAIFLDRDGVINRDGIGKGGYITKWSEFHFLPRSLEALKILQEAHYKVIIISNQAGVAKGIYSKEDLDHITEKMLEKVGGAGGKIHSVNYCLHRDEDNCSCRKPRAGLFHKAARDMDKIDFNQTCFIGDSARDVEAGKNAGCKTILVFSGKARPSDLDSWKTKPDFIAQDLLDAVKNVVFPLEGQT